MRKLTIAIAAAMFAGLALSPKLWLSERFYPMTPVFAALRPIPYPLDYIAYGLLLGLLVSIAVASRPAKLIWVFVALAVVVALFDQSRCQPWFYQYIVMLIAVALSDPQKNSSAMNTSRLVMACTYFWSGMQKTNGDFIHNVFPYMLGPFSASLAPFAVLAPLLELSIGIGLLTRRFRNYAVVGAVAMHAFILLSIGPFGQNSNSVVWPWNIAMIYFLFLLFWRHPEFSARQIVWSRQNVYQMVVLLLFGIAPIFSFFNLWDGYLSSALYSGVRNASVINIADGLRDRLPNVVRAHIYASNRPGTGVLIPREWAMSELNAAIYPEPRIYKNIARSLCGYTHDTAELKLWIKQSNVLLASDKQTSYDCDSLGFSGSAKR